MDLITRSSPVGGMESLLSVFASIKAYLKIHGNLILLHGETGLALNHSVNPFFGQFKEHGFKINRFGPLKYAYLQENPVYIPEINNISGIKPSGFTGYLGNSLVVYPVKIFSVYLDCDVYATFHSSDNKVITEWDYHVISLVMDKVLPEVILKSEILRFLGSNDTTGAVRLLQSKEETLHDLKNAICPFYFIKEMTGVSSVHHKAIERLISKSNQFFQITHNDDGIVDEDVAEIDAREIFSAIEMFFSGFPDLNLQFKLPVGPVKIRIKPLQFESLFVNLIKNSWEACKQISKKASVTVKCRKVQNKDRGKCVFFHLSENGPGFDPFILKKIMTGQVVTTKSSGSGIGFRSIRRILKDHRASFRLYSVSEKGTHVLIRLPQGA